MVQEYVLDKIWLCTGLNLIVSDSRDEIARGLLSKDATNLISREFDTTDAILQELLRFERLDNSRRQRTSEKRAVSGRSSYLSRTATNEMIASGMKKEVLR